LDIGCVHKRLLSDLTQDLLPALFQHGSLEDRLTFASRFGYFLRQMQQAARQQLWKGWLRRYWHDRLQGMFATLDEIEMRKMLEWLLYLGEAFLDAAALAVRFPAIRIEHSRIVYEMRESELATQFAVETAELLIYLANYLVGYHATDLGKINARLPPLPAQLRSRLDEALARSGVLRE